MSSPRILVVEDECLVALDICAQLRGIGYEHVDTARNAHHALELARKNPPDLALLDIHIDGPIDGIDLASQLRAELHTAVIFLTAYADEGTLERAKHTEPHGYLVKPVTHEELRSAVVVAMYKHRMEEERRQAGELDREFERRRLRLQHVETIGRLSGGVAHELNNALTEAMANISLITNFTIVNTEMKNQLDAAMSGCIRASNVVRQLVGFSRQGQYHPVQLDIHTAVAEVVDDLSPLLGNLEVSVEESPRALDIRADREQFRQLLAVLLSYFQRAASQIGTVGISFSEEYVDSPDAQNPTALAGNYVVLRLTHYGVDVDNDFICQAFEPFVVKRCARRTPPTQGTGLELPMVQGILQGHGGWVTLRSGPESGTEFALYFPEDTVRHEDTVQSRRWENKSSSYANFAR